MFFDFSFSNNELSSGFYSSNKLTNSKNATKLLSMIIIKVIVAHLFSSDKILTGLLDQLNHSQING